MGTIVTVCVVNAEGRQHDPATVEAAIGRALAWFGRVESACSRFDHASELRRLCANPGVAVPVSPILFQAVQFAHALAAQTEGAFDLTLGAPLSARGFNRHYSTGATIEAAPAKQGGTFRDVMLDAERQTITLRAPLLLDLGAVAKGLAIDLAAHEVRPFANFMIDAGGDVYVGGNNPSGAAWSVGIRHPRQPGALIETIRVSDAAVCTSGDYERIGADGGHHILDPRDGTPARSVASATVIAPTAMIADGLATAAFVLGPVDGCRLLEEFNVDGLVVTPTLECFRPKRDE